MKFSKIQIIVLLLVVHLASSMTYYPKSELQERDQNSTFVGGNILQLGPDMYEPDNTSTTASPIEIGETQARSIYPEGDIDWLWVNVTEANSYIVETEVGVDTVIFLYNSSLQLIATDDDGGENFGSKIGVSLQVGIYYVEVQGYNMSNIGSYNISFSVYTDILPPDSYEPDNSFDDATQLEIGISQNHSIHSEVDTDFYIFTVSENSNIVAETTGLSGDTIMRMYNENREEIAYDDDGGDGLFSRINIFLVPGTYYLEVLPYPNSGIVPWYIISLSGNMSDPNDGYEWDNSFDTASRINIGENQNHSLPAGDVDFVYFVLNSPTTINIFTNGTLGDTILTLYDQNQNFLADNDDGGYGFFSSIVLSLSPGTYYGEVRSFSMSEEIDFYNIILIEGAAPDTYEPDNEQLTATTLDFFESQTHTISDFNDEDYFVFEIQNTTEVIIETNGTIGDTYISLLDQLGSEIISNDDNGGYFSMIRIEIPQGVYYIRVRGYFSFEYSILLENANVPPTTTTVSTVSNTSQSTEETIVTPTLDLPINVYAIFSAMGLLFISRRRKK